MSTDTDFLKVLEAMRAEKEKEYRDTLLMQTHAAMRLVQIEEQLLALSRAMDAERRRRDS